MTRPSPRRLVGTLLVAALLVADVAPATARQPADCGTSPAGNGTGYHPPSNPASLPSESPRPGPDILYEPLATSPQLENTGPWRAAPIMISGTRSYRDGEFVYQDFLYDDLGLPYPDEPERYAGNAADIVEVRVKPLADAVGVRITYNSMLDVDAAAATIALGNSESPLPLPADAGAVAPGEVFVTVHGCTAEIVRAGDGAVLPVAPTVMTDLARRQVHVEVPYEAFDPRGRTDVRIATATGLWDADAGTYRRPDPERPAFLNVAFRENGPWTQNTWMTTSQDAALAAGDLSPLFATVDFTRLEAGVDDDLVDQPGGVPSHGPMNRILVSHVEPTQGRGNSSGGDITGGYACHPPGCTPLFSGRLQPYSVYVPDAPPPPSGYGLVVNLHGANSNHNHFETGPPDPPLETWQMLAETGRPSIMAMPNGRGPTYFYFGLAAADVFEMWADVAANHDLDPRYVVQTGSSMGGYGTYKFASQFPDLYTAILPNIGINSASLSVPHVVSVAGEDTDAWRMFASLRNVPVLATNAANDPVVSFQNTSSSMQLLHDLGYRYDYWWFAGETAGGGHAEYRHYVREQFRALMDDRGPTDRDPRRVTYVLNGHMHQPKYGVNADHAYWLSGLRLRDDSVAPPLGTIDVVSHGFPAGDPTAQAQEQSGGPGSDESLPYTRARRGWGEAPSAPVADVLDVTASNVAAVTIDVDRARVSCDATINVDSDGPLEITLVGLGCDGMVRVAGADRIATAVAVSRRGYDTADTVVIASGYGYADALAGGPLAAERAGPLLLTASDRLSRATAAEIERLGAARAILLGGEAAVGPAVQEHLTGMGLAVERIFGPDRFATAAEIADALADRPSRVFVTEGIHADPARGWPDALAVAPLAAFTGAPVLLVAADRAPAATIAALKRIGPDEVVIVGGEQAVSSQVAVAITGAGHRVTRIAGATRYDTAAQVHAAAVTAGMTPTWVWLATGRDFPDALAAGPTVAALGASFTLVDGHDLAGSPETHALLDQADVTSVTLLGGEAAITPTVATRISERITR